MTLHDDMTLDLDAIRARDAETTPYAVREGEYAQCKAAMDDRRALLAEVDRLTAELDDLTVGAIRAAERARIRAAVEGLPYTAGVFGEMDYRLAVDRAAVLAAIDGAEH